MYYIFNNKVLLRLRVIALNLWVEINETPQGLKYSEVVSVIRLQVPCDYDICMIIFRYYVLN